MGSDITFIDSEFGRFDRGDAGTFTTDLVSVAMPFKEQESDEVYKVIREECTRVGLHPCRVDEYVKSGVVLRDIAELIEQAEFLIFDLSHERQNVYYELGYAHGVGNRADEILLIAQEGTQLHYDVAGLRVHFYQSPDDLHRILSTGLAYMMKECRR